MHLSSDLVETFVITSDSLCMISVKNSFLSLVILAGEAILKSYLRKDVVDHRWLAVRATKPSAPEFSQQ